MKTSSESPQLDVGSIVLAAAVGILAMMLALRWRRITHTLNTREKLLKATISLAIIGKYLATEPPDELTGRAQSNVEIDRTQRLAAAKDRIGKMFDEVGEFAAAYRQPVMGLVIGYITTMHGVMLSVRTPERKGALLADLSEALALIIGVPMWQVWHVPKRIAALDRFKQLMADIDASASVGDPVPQE